MAPRALLAAALLLLGGILALADLAPVIGSRLERAGAPTVAGAGLALARLSLAPTCHQRAERSFLVAGAPLNACARCVGLHAGSLVAGAAILAGGRLRRRGGVALVLASLVAMALDVAAGLAWPMWDHPMLRLATGAFVVIAAGLAAAGHLAPARIPPDSNSPAPLAGALRCE